MAFAVVLTFSLSSPAFSQNGNQLSFGFTGGGFLPMTDENRYFATGGGWAITPGTRDFVLNWVLTADQIGKYTPDLTDQDGVNEKHQCMLAEIEVGANATGDASGAVNVVTKSVCRNMDFEAQNDAAPFSRMAQISALGYSGLTGKEKECRYLLRVFTRKWASDPGDLASVGRKILDSLLAIQRALPPGRIPPVGDVLLPGPTVITVPTGPGGAPEPGHIVLTDPIVLPGRIPPQIVKPETEVRVRLPGAHPLAKGTAASPLSRVETVIRTGPAIELKGAVQRVAQLPYLEQTLPYIRNASKTVSFIEYVVKAYLYTGRVITRDGQRYEEVKPAGSYGYVVHHIGKVGAWDSQMKNARIRKFDDTTYVMSIPAGSALEVMDSLRAVEE